MKAVIFKCILTVNFIKRNTSLKGSHSALNLNQSYINSFPCINLWYQNYQNIRRLLDVLKYRWLNWVSECLNKLKFSYYKILKLRTRPKQSVSRSFNANTPSNIYNRKMYLIIPNILWMYRQKISGILFIQYLVFINSYVKG